MIQPGTLLQNRYRVAEQIGKGGMGEVYVATDVRFQNTVAIKRTFYEDPEMRRAFGREARLLNHLRHAALPKVSDHFSEGGDHFLVMEYVEGSDLSEIMKQRKVPFPLADVLRWADELLDALDYLHTQEPSVVHRDIKPPNIKLTKRGSIVLLDFGLAKVMPAQADAGTASSVFGYSVNFAPLEQMQGSGTDPRSDLYSLAATLYYLLTGVRPADALTRASATVRQEPDPLRPAHLLQPQVPAAVSHVLTRAMSQNAVRRHASAAEMRAALRQAAGGVAQLEARPALSAASIVPQSERSYHEATVVESSALAGSSAQPQTAGLRDSQARPRTVAPSRALSSSAPRGVEDAPFADSRRQPRISDSYTVIAPAASTREGSSAKRSLALVACLLVVCALVGTYLLTRASDARAPSVETNAGAQISAPQYDQAAPATQTTTGTNAAASDSSHAASDSNAPTQPASSRPASDTTASSSQSASQTADASHPTDAQGSNAAAAGAGNSAGASSGGRPALVIQNPASAVSTAEEPRRSEEPRRDQPAPGPAYADRPPPGAYPPPPDDRRPPPPDGRRPPPNFRPPPP